MINLSRLKRSIFLIILAQLISSCSNGDEEYCNKLLVLANDKKVQDELIKWSRINIFDNDIYLDSVQSGGNRIPGYYMFSLGSDIPVFDMDINDLQIRIVGPTPTDVVNNKIKNVKSISFSERSRFSILVKRSGSKDYGLVSDQKYLRFVTNDIAVLCITGD